MTRPPIEELAGLVEKATPGPWGRDCDGGIRSSHTAENGYASEYIASLDHYRDDRLSEREGNYALIVALRNHAPALLAYVAHLESLAEARGRAVKVFRGMLSELRADRLGIAEDMPHFKTVQDARAALAAIPKE